MKKTHKKKVFLETSGIIYHRHGHSLMKDAVNDATSGSQIAVSNFIRMEYLRGLILNLIELYFLIKESSSVDDALIDWSQKVKQERKLKVVLMTVCSWICSQGEWNQRENSLRRLGELIVRYVREFDEYFPGRIKDTLRCELGKLKFPKKTFQEDLLLQFLERMRSIQSGIPNCHLCWFKKSNKRYCV